MNELSLKQQRWAKEMRLKALDMAYGTGSNGSHIGGAFSSMEIFSCLYTIMNFNPTNSKEESRDRLIVSKGHCVLAYYSALYKAGFLKEDDLLTFDKNGTLFHGHPTRNLDHGIEFSSGSLGLGISFATGVAVACKRKGVSNRIYVLLGDGECNEGLVWEALMNAANLDLANLTVIVDCNGFQLDGDTNEVLNMFSIADKFKSFGFDTKTIDGHNCDDITVALKYESAQPIAILAKTTKAKGISFLTNNKISHHCVLSANQYEQAMNEILNM